MSILYDYHLHSDFSADSDTPAEEMIRRAVSLGLSGICFTEHMDLDCPEDGLDFTFDPELYFAQILPLKERYAGRLEILAGMEFGLLPDRAPALDSLTGRWPFDFIIGSLHFINGKDPYFPAYFEGHSEHDCYQEYFREELRLLRQYSDYDVLGHMDYIVRYGPNRNRNYSFRAYADCIDPILRHLIEHGKCLELNTGGLKYGLGEPNPSTDVLRRYRELGGELITIGSDAHRPEHLAYDFAAAEEILQSLGFRYYTVFRERKGRQIRL